MLHPPPSVTPDTPPAAPLAGGVDTSRLTVILPTYNRKEALRRCVLGLLACDVEGLDVTLRVVDDGSPDETTDVMKELQRQNEGPIRLEYHRQENQGQSAARNLAINASDTDVILFIDDDCIPDPGWIRAMAAVSWDGDVGAVGGRLVAATKGNWISRYCRFIRYNEFPVDDRPLTFVNSANCAYLRRALEEVGGYECALPRGVDHDLGWRVVLAGYRLVYAPDAVVHHFHRESLRIVLKDCWTRGASNTLRSALWGKGKRPSAWRLVRECLIIALSMVDLLLVPVEAFRLARQGVAPVDALPYALVGWLRRIYGRCGKVSMLRRLLSGEQKLQRTSRMPEGRQAPEHAPHWARVGADEAGR